MLKLTLMRAHNLGQLLALALALPARLRAYGGLVAAPIFSRIAERVARQLDLAPTMPPISLQPTPLASTTLTEERSN